jgi:hypothetical protein
MLSLLGAGPGQYSVGFEPEYTAVLNRADALAYIKPSVVQQSKQNSVIRDLKAAGAWALLDVFYMFWTDASGGNFATINWVNPAGFQATRMNNPVFTINSGFNGNGANSYLSIGVNLTTTTNYKLNNSSFFAWMVTNQGTAAANGTIWGEATGTNTNQASALNTAGPIRMNTSTAIGADFTGTGLKYTGRLSGIITSYNNNGAAQITNTADNSASQNASIDILRRFGNSYGISTIGCFALGANLNSRYTQIYNTLNNYFI